MKISRQIEIIAHWRSIAGEDTGMINIAQTLQLLRQVSLHSRRLDLLMLKSFLEFLLNSRFLKSISKETLAQFIRNY